jgi:hypothetical protein
MISTSSPSLTVRRSIQSGHHRAAARDRLHAFDRHQERPILWPLGQLDIGVERLEQFQDGLIRKRSGLAAQRLDRRAAHDRRVVAVELVLRQQIAHLELDQIEQLRIVSDIALVQEHHDARHADLARQQDVLTRLRHRAVHGGDDQDRAVHLRRARDHVLHIIGMAGAVDVRVMARRRRKLDVAGRNRENLRVVTRTLRGRRLGDVLIRDERAPAVIGRDLRHRRRQRRLAMIHMADRAHVAIGLEAGELLFGHRTPVVLELPYWVCTTRGTTRAHSAPGAASAPGHIDCQVRRSVRPKADPRRTRALALPSSALMLSVTAALLDAWVAEFSKRSA